MATPFPVAFNPASHQTNGEHRAPCTRVLRLFQADPEPFNTVFCANATTGMKHVVVAFADQKGDLEYRYHVDAHTSLVGMRGLAGETTCFSSEAEVEI